MSPKLARLLVALLQISSLASSEIFSVTRELPIIFQEDLIQVSLYHECIVEQKNGLSPSMDLGVCQEALKHIHENATAVFGDPRDLDFFDVPREELLGVASNISSLVASNLAEPESILKNEFLEKFSRQPNLGPTVVPTSKTDSVKLFKFGIFLTYLRAETYALVACAKVANALTGAEVSYPVPNSDLLNNLRSTAKHIREAFPRLEADFSRNPDEVASLKGILKTYFMEQEMLGEGQSCSAYASQPGSHECDGFVYDCEDLHTKKLKLEVATDKTTSLYTCVTSVDETNKTKLIYGKSNCNFVATLSPRTSSRGFCNCTCNLKKDTINVFTGEALADVGSNKFISGIHPIIWNKELKFNLKVSKLVAVNDSSFGEFASEYFKPWEDHKNQKYQVADLNAFRFRLGDIRASKGSVITGVRLKTNPVRFEIREHKVDLIRGVLLGNGTWKTDYPEQSLLRFKLLDRNTMGGKILPEVTQAVVEAAFPLSTVGFKEFNGTLIAPRLGLFDLGYLFEMNHAQAWGKEVPIRWGLITTISVGALVVGVSTLMGVVWYRKRPRYDTPPISRASTPPLELPRDSQSDCSSDFEDWNSTVH